MEFVPSVMKPGARAESPFVLDVISVSALPNTDSITAVDSFRVSHAVHVLDLANCACFLLPELCRASQWYCGLHVTVRGDKTVAGKRMRKLFSLLSSISAIYQLRAKCEGSDNDDRWRKFWRCLKRNSRDTLRTFPGTVLDRADWRRDFPQFKGLTQRWRWT